MTYRNRPPPARAYSVKLRVWPCDTCGEALDVGNRSGSVSCLACGGQTEVSEPVDLTVPHSTVDESMRQVQLAAGRFHAFQLHPAAVKYASILDGEHPEVRRLWGEARRAFVQRGGDDAAHLLFSTTFVLLNNLPITPEHELDRRALCEATAEVLEDPSRRQRMLSRLARGAASAGDYESARQWLKRMDPRSADLPADTAYRVSSAWLATAESRWADVLDQLGAKAGTIPMTPSHLIIAALLRGNAHEKLGDLRRAQAGLAAVARKRKTGLATLELIARATPEWKLCEQALPKVRAIVLATRARHLKRGLREHLAPLLALGLVVGGWFASQGQWLDAAIASAAGLVGVVIWTHSSRRVRRIARDAILVEGRVHDAEALGGNRARLHVDLEPADGSPHVSAVVDASVPSPLTAETIVGRSFDGYWNPAYPRHFVHVVFQVPSH